MIVSSRDGFVPFPCEVLCVSLSSATLSSLTCRTEYPLSQGLVSVNVSGNVSSPIPFDYDGLLSLPELEAGSGLPATCPSVGCTVRLLGKFLASTEVVVSNLLATWVVPVTIPGDSTVSVGRRHFLRVPFHPGL